MNLFLIIIIILIIVVLLYFLYKRDDKLKALLDKVVSDNKLKLGNISIHDISNDSSHVLDFKRIYINSKDQNEKSLLDMICHEVAHIVTKTNQHDSKFIKAYQTIVKNIK